VTRTVSIRNAHPRLRVPAPAVRRAIDLLDAGAAKFLAGCPPGELSLVFLTDPALTELHERFMGDPTPTDVITFEGAGGSSAEPAGSAGEICVSVDTAARFVRRPAGRKGPAAGPTEFAAELTLYLVHGWLHLAGYDDRQPARKRRMRAAEKRAMHLLRNAAAIPAFRLA
jgi:probable rRNA maturation factor